MKKHNFNISFKSYPGQQQSSAIVWSLLLPVGIQPEVPLIASAPPLSIALKEIQPMLKQCIYYF
jgi:hypothetical protein